MGFWPFPLNKFRQGKQRLIECGYWYLPRIQKLNGLSLNVHAIAGVADFSSNKGRSAHWAGQSFTAGCLEAW